MTSDRKEITQSEKNNKVTASEYACKNDEKKFSTQIETFKREIDMKNRIEKIIENFFDDDHDDHDDEERIDNIEVNVMNDDVTVKKLFSSKISLSKMIINEQAALLKRLMTIAENIFFTDVIDLNMIEIVDDVNIQSVIQKKKFEDINIIELNELCNTADVTSLFYLKTCKHLQLNSTCSRRNQNLKLKL